MLSCACLSVSEACKWRGCFTAVGHKLQSACCLCLCCICVRESSEPMQASFHLPAVAKAPQRGVCAISVPAQPENPHHLEGFCRCGRASETCRDRQKERLNAARPQADRRTNRTKKKGSKRIFIFVSVKENITYTHVFDLSRQACLCVCVCVFGGADTAELQPAAVCQL